MQNRNGLVSIVVLGLIASGCEPRGVSDAHMSSKSDGSDNVSTFAVSSPSIYFHIEYSALSEGDSLVAKLVFGGQQLTEQGATVPSDGDGVMTGGFTNQSPPWAAGAYELQIWLDGAKVKGVPFSFK